MLGMDLNIIERGVRGIFGREFITRQRKVKYPQYATIVDSDKQTERYNTISTVPQLKLTTDERVMSGFSDYTYDLTNKIYTNGIKIPRTLFEFDQTSQIRTLVQSVGARVVNFPDSLMAALLGDNGAGYDKVAFAATTHDLGNGTSQSNLLTGHLTDTLIAGATKANRDDAIAAFQLDFVAAKAQLMALTDDRGEPWHDDADPASLLIICHPAAEFFVRTAIEAAVVSDTGNLTMKQVGSILTINRQTPFTVSSTFRKGTWYLMKVDTPLKPLIFQRFGPKVNFDDVIPEEDQSIYQALNSVEVQTVMRAGSNISEYTFFNDEFLIGSRVIYTGGYGMWQNCIRVNGAA
jgi:phage major head subunit gpT-like protein